MTNRKEFTNPNGLSAESIFKKIKTTYPTVYFYDDSTPNYLIVQNHTFNPKFAVLVQGDKVIVTIANPMLMDAEEQSDFLETIGEIL